MLAQLFDGHFDNQLGDFQANRGQGIAPRRPEQCAGLNRVGYVRAEFLDRDSRGIVFFCFGIINAFVEGRLVNVTLLQQGIQNCQLLCVLLGIRPRCRVDGLGFLDGCL